MGEFRITGPGRYRMRNEEITNVRRFAGGITAPWQCEKGYYEDDGTFNLRDLYRYDIVAGPLPDGSEAAGLSGFITLSPDGRAWSGEAIDAHSARVPEPHIVIDLSCVPAIAIVKPEREKRKVWLIFDKHGNCRCWDNEPFPHNFSRLAWSNLSAIVEREIEFTHGEGLGLANG